MFKAPGCLQVQLMLWIRSPKAQRPGLGSCRSHVALPSLLPSVAILEAPDHAKLRGLAPDHSMLTTPACHGKVSPMGKGVAGLLMRVEPLKASLPPHRCEHIQDVAMKDLHCTRHLLERRMQILQRFADEGQVLQRCIGLLPQLGLHHIHHSNGTLRCGAGQRRVVLPAQISLEPDEFKSHQPAHERTPSPGPQTIAGPTDLF